MYHKNSRAKTCLKKQKFKVLINTIRHGLLFLEKGNVFESSDTLYLKLEE